VPITYVDKSVQDIPTQVKGIYTNDQNVLACCGHFIENSKEQFLLIEERCPVYSMLLLFTYYQDWGIQSIAIPESVWDASLRRGIGEADISPTLEVFICRGE
jgi:hypothetical protein